ncbi:MAG TPA: helix-hairpin-helix domain-containing protein [Chitinophagaceae bacterium]|nr:helix-hairpin-helix domain-containing protein [Chitinophagaceae bacterium]
MKLVKQILVTAFAVFSSLFIYSQEIPVSTEQQLENLTNATEEETEDDTFLQDLERFRKNPLNLNSTDADELRQLRFLTDLQIDNFISYRNIFGHFLSIYELQAVPAWDISTIKMILPFVTTATPLLLKNEIGKRFRDGDHSFLLRVSQVLEKSKGFDHSTSGTKYLGSPQRIFFRYRYVYKNLLQFGFAGDKDAGEQFFKGAQKKGFDFYSFHLFARKIGIIQSLALGDFTVNMGQGLIQWQGLAFKKSVDVLGVKRQSAVLRPYSSAGEYYFHRGAGITIRKGKVEGTAFFSVRKLSSNFVSDTVNNEDFISSFLTSGYHRTNTEIGDRNNLTQTAFGGNLMYRGNKWHIGLNGIAYNFSLPVQKRDEPYNLYAISGKSWSNISVDYSYTYKNLHFFGEAAADKNFNKAFINGLLVSVDPRVDLSFVQRTINKAYQAVNGNAFTENTYPTNETGFYTGITIRPYIGWRIDAYADLFKFPWLKYLVDAPSRGKEYLAQVTFTPNKEVEIYTRFRNETKQTNQSGNTTVTNLLVTTPRQNWRTQVSYKLNTAITLRNRIELLWYDRKGDNSETGFLGFIDFIYRPLLKPFSGLIRLQYFETNGYNSRIYAYENDVLFSYSIPAFFDKGFRYYALLNYDLGKKISFWLRLAQTVYQNKQTVGSGLDEISGRKKTEIKLQLRYIL